MTYLRKNIYLAQNIIFCVCLIALTLPSCRSMPRVHLSKVNLEISKVKSAISRSRDNIILLKDKRVGNSGFYYIINNDGVVIFHPQSVLIGRSFKKFWFIDAILKEKSGCLKYYVGEKEQTIYYRDINEYEILCFSIMSEEVDDSTSECKTADDYKLETDLQDKTSNIEIEE